MVGIFITARLGSTRLSQKHLIEVEGKSMIKWLVERFDFGFKKEILEQKIKIFITTSDKEENRLFETVFENSNVKIFYGSNSNIPLRHLQCAKAHNIDYILSVDGDDILCSIEASKIVLEELINNGNLVKTIGLPLGMNVMGYTTTFLESSLSANTQETLETGWGKIFDQQFTKELEIENNFNCDNIRMTLDYNEDAIFFSNVIKGISEGIISIADKELISKIINYKWYQINESLNDKYWENFNNQKKSEN
jgi:spore coat polysaccharide biosynthesis protein SpsF (cytidylyltransferase family)